MYYIIGLVTGIILSLIVYLVHRNRAIVYKLDKINKNKKYINSISIEIKELVGLFLFYIKHKDPSNLLRKETEKVVIKESKKWGVRADDTNNLWINIRNNISNSSSDSDREKSSNI